MCYRCVVTLSLRSYGADRGGLWLVESAAFWNRKGEVTSAWWWAESQRTIWDVTPVRPPIRRGTGRLRWRSFLKVWVPAVLIQLRTLLLTGPLMLKVLYGLILIWTKMDWICPPSSLTHSCFSIYRELRNEILGPILHEARVSCCPPPVSLHVSVRHVGCLHV